MNIDWEKFRSVLKRAYFGDNGILHQETAVYEDFWKFFKQYQTVAARKGINKSDRNADHHSEASSSRYAVNSFGLHFKYNAHYKQSVDFEIGRTERYMLRDVPENVVAEFEYILHCYVQFCQKEHLAKLKKLRSAQRALPMFAHKQEMLDAIATNRVIIISGDTGCGKSTQLPQYLLEAGYKKIVCTQPRRIACISLAKRVAFETLNEYGNEIAYQIRFEKTKTANTRMLFLTEGLLLRQLSGDPLLSSYDVIILDEVHERHLHADFLLGILKELANAKRPDLRLILMSATININLVSSYFDDNAPVVTVPGRLYPISLHYRPLTDLEVKAERIDPGPYLRLLQMIDGKYPPTERGDVLVFLSGISEITTIAETLSAYAEQNKRWIILMLHSTLSIEEQDKVFDIAPEGARKCILSTNIAETSVTIDGVRFVIDSGKVKEMRYDSSTRMHRLQEIFVSKASAEQRKGRAGRTGPGICYRLYSQADFDKAELYATSEIHRVSLESLCLQMLSLGINARKFNFIEAPAAAVIEQALESLKDQDAVANNDELTSLGRILTNLPVDVAIGKMLVMGCLFRQVEAVLTVSATLSVQSPFVSKSFRDLDAMALRQNLMSDHGDAFALLKTYREWLEVKQSGESTRNWAKKRGIEEARLYDITKLRNQFKDILEQAELIEKRALEQSSTDRRLRYGEMKRLKELKRKLQGQQRQRKVLKVNSFEAALADDDEKVDGEAHLSDANAVDFHMKHTQRDIELRVSETDLSHAIVSLLKLIIASSLYPQYGILDPHNSYRQGSDQIVHTRQKPFVILHPNSCLGQDPEVLRVDNDEQNFSTQYQLIFYSLLLETTKPYLVNSIRVPALHTLLIVARSIDTNRDCSRLVVDGWIEFATNDAANAQILLFEAIAIRKMLAECLLRKLAGDSYFSDALCAKLLEFLQMEILFNVKRLMKADQNSLYAGEGSGQVVIFPVRLLEQFQLTMRPNSTKGGMQMTEFLTYGCLLEQGDSTVNAEHYLTIAWTCPMCQERIFVSPPERLEHLSKLCASRQNAEATEAAVKVLQDGKHDTFHNEQITDKNPLKRVYFCQECNSNLSLTTTEILKHKKSHKTAVQH